MKRLIMMLLCVFLLAGSAQADLTITRIDLDAPGEQHWTTFNNPSYYVVGVSSELGGALLNKSDRSSISVPLGTSYLYAQPGTLSSYPQLTVYLSDNTTISATFQINGVNGSGTAWTRTAGSDAITLGWAASAWDKVNGFDITSGGGTDFTLKVGIVPLPPTVLLLGSGLLGLVGWRRFRKS